MPIGRVLPDMTRYQLGDLLIASYVVSRAQLGDELPGCKGVVGQQVGADPQIGEFTQRGHL